MLPDLVEDRVASGGTPCVHAIVCFDYGRAALGKEELAHLRKVARRISARRPALISVDGYADVRGPTAENRDLAWARVDAVNRQMDANLPKASRDLIVPMSHGEELSDAADHAEWRKVTITARAPAAEPATPGKVRPLAVSEPTDQERGEEMRRICRETYDTTRGIGRALELMGQPIGQILLMAQTGYPPLQIDDFLQYRQRVHARTAAPDASKHPSLAPDGETGGASDALLSNATRGHETIYAMLEFREALLVAAATQWNEGANAEDRILEIQRAQAEMRRDASSLNLEP